MLKIISWLEDYEPWGGAIATYDKIIDGDKLKELEELLEDSYPDGIEEMQLNEILWYNDDHILSSLGISEKET